MVLHRPLLVALPILLALAWLALAQSVRRPRNGSDAELVRVDDALRRLTAEGVVATVGGASAASLLVWSAMVLVTTAGNSCDPVSLGAFWGSWPILIGSLGLTVTWAARLLVPGDARP